MALLLASGCSRREAPEPSAQATPAEQAPGRFGLRPPRKSPVQPLSQVEDPDLETDDSEDVQLPPPALSEKKPSALPQPRLNPSRPKPGGSQVALQSQQPGQAAIASPDSPNPTPGAGTAVSPERKRANYARRYWKMDTDKDGVVSEVERSAAFEWMLTHREKFRARVDRDQNGAVSDAERKAALERFRVRPPRGHRPTGTRSPSP